ncbi:hypothetical protein WMY93_023343 [Mugilogobius chulae]|uniref:PQ-loop repeat-containing protein 1 n=1 Tax=Mugilogobius chulae TaxID=88201 RepID=A0AAW0N8E7_9GOBI
MDTEVGLQEEDVEASWTLLSWLASCLMVFGGALPYVPQYQEIQRSSNTEGFSTRVCLVLLIANILRIFFCYFWKWSLFEDYMLFCLGFTVLCAGVTLLLLDSVVFVEALGSLALLFEAMLGLPQLLQNFSNHSTKGMSVKMVLLWTAGDVFKTTYFILNDSPAQFWICGSTQIFIDVAILLQVLLYNQDTRIKLG